MLGTLLTTLLLATTPIPPDTTAALPNTPPPDSSASRRRVVREFPPVEVQALLHDLSSSQTVHVIPGAALRRLPLDGVAGVLALQPGVVSQGEELHVRGGRAGETAVMLDGLVLNEPARGRFMEVPLLALRSAELVSGAPEARYASGLAGVLDLRSIHPTARVSSELRWQTDGRLGTHYDRIAGRVSAPLGILGLGAVTAGDATLDDTWLPALRNNGRRRVAGTSWGWRAENRLLGFLKLAPLERPERFAAEVLVSREIHQPYNPSFTLDGWVFVPANLKVTPTFSTEPRPGYQRYRAADHVAITDDRRIAAFLKVATPNPARRLSAQLGWLRTRTLTSIGNRRENELASHRPRYGSPLDNDRFIVLWGDYPLYREGATDVVSLRGEGEIVTRTGSITAGAGVSNDQVSMLEMDWMPFAIRAGDEGLPPPLDSIRTYRATAPGGFGFVQGRWRSGGLVMNTGVRLEYFTAGDEALTQTLPGDAGGTWSFSPRLGFAYPISLRDVFSLAYVRIHQAPGRDFLYDRRTAISDRQPLGNPALTPATMISYEAAVKHVFGPAWALQAALFYRDVFGQVGALDEQIPQGPINLRYANADESHTLGCEWSVIHAAGEGRRIEAHYVYLSAWGNESRAEGDPYGPVRGADLPPIGDRPLSWDRTHSLVVNGTWTWARRLSVSWSTAIGSPLPWTPKPLRAPLTDLAVVNSRRLDWTENTDLSLQWTPPRLARITLGLEARNLFDQRTERAATLDGYPNPAINTLYDDYGAYRTETGNGGGAYWSHITGRWVPVHDPRLYLPPRALRASVGMAW